MAQPLSHKRRQNATVTRVTRNLLSRDRVTIALPRRRRDSPASRGLPSCPPTTTSSLSCKSISMNGRLLRQALFSSSEPDAHSSSTLSGAYTEAIGRSGSPAATQYAQPAPESSHSLLPRGGVFFSESLAQDLPHDSKLMGSRNLASTQSSPRGARQTDDQQLTDRSKSILPFFADASRPLSRGPGLRTTGQENASDFARAQQRKSRAFSQTRPGRSLHQRLDPGMAYYPSYVVADAYIAIDDEQAPPPYPTFETSQRVTEVHHMQAFRRSEEMPPHAPSRSVSVLSSTHGRHQEDDLSSIMMRGATDLRHAKFELEEQVVISVVRKTHIC